VLLQRPPPSTTGEDADLQRALAKSKQTHEEAERRARQEQAEIDIVIEYVKKQSLAESELQQTQ